MKKLDGHMAGLILGAFMGLFHLGWALLVSAGLAKGLLDWIYGLHFLSNPFRVAPFDATTAVVLVVVTSVFGYVAGLVFAWLWNMVARRK